MGNRSHLIAYFKEDVFSEKERKYYTEYMNSKLDNEGIKKLLMLAKEVKDVWNDNFEYFGDNDIPSCDVLKVNGNIYFAPNTCYSKTLGFHWEKRNTVPDYFLILFSPEEYKDRHEIRGHIYGNNRFYTTVEKALSRINRRVLISEESHQLKKLLESLPKESILELDFSEVIKSEYNSTYHELDYFLTRVKKLSKNVFI